ncbi:GNAT family N-acetyltransferase [Arsukibacterium sp.]|uniref:GNAT family N-acetyltransferase n=1 Tax=Arsukibacterium sp. TaxID=1977258 RepID=UPI00299EE5CA|nr:GNAT family N-acetyltransferase [Arsukibacterium sp.]MDX1677336.1 GNAT family N-acetyltransferase [Arsukibacterium sp.]
MLSPILNPMPPAEPVLSLSPLTPAAEPLFIALFSCPQVMQYIQPPLSVDEARQRFGRILKLSTGPAYYLVNHSPSQQNIGLAMLNILPEQGSAEIGRMLLPAWQQQGLGTALGQLLLQTASADSRVTQLTTRIHSTNNAAISSARKLGFAQQHRLPDDFLLFSLQIK